MHTFIPQDPSEITSEMRQKAIASLVFLKEKRNGDVKARAYANGSKQRTYTKKSDATYTTACTEAVFLAAFIEAYEERDVTILNIHGAFLHTETDKDVIMVLEGPFAELMVQVDPYVYRNYITTNSKGKPILYVNMYKELYGMLRSDLMFYRKLVKDLEE